MGVKMVRMFPDGRSLLTMVSQSANQPTTARSWVRLLRSLQVVSGGRRLLLGWKTSSCLHLETAISVPNFCRFLEWIHFRISVLQSVQPRSVPQAFLCVSNAAPLPVKLIFRQTDVQAGFIDAQEGPWGFPVLSCFHPRMGFCWPPKTLLALGFGTGTGVLASSQRPGFRLGPREDAWAAEHGGCRGGPGSRPNLLCLRAGRDGFT